MTERKKSKPFKILVVQQVLFQRLYFCNLFKSYAPICYYFATKNEMFMEKDKTVEFV